MENINFSPTMGDFKNKKEKCICIPLSLGQKFDVDEVNYLGDTLEKKYSNLIFTKRWSTYDNEKGKGYMFFYQ